MDRRTEKNTTATALPQDPAPLYWSTHQVIKALCTGKNTFYAMLRADTRASIALHKAKAGHNKWLPDGVREAARLACRGSR